MPSAFKKRCSKTHYVYALCEPETGEVRYIGCTTRLKARFRQHLKVDRAVNPRVAEWVTSLIGRDLLPQMKILETVKGMWPGWEAERYLIGVYSVAMRERLLNEHYRGDFVPFGDLEEIAIRYKRYWDHQKLWEKRRRELEANPTKYHPVRMITFNGKTQNMSARAKKLGISKERMRQRLDSGRSLEAALTTPKNQTPQEIIDSR